MKRTGINKRTWAPFIDTKNNGKWYTGYDGYYGSKGIIADMNSPHEVRTLTLTPVNTTRGRSSANMIFADKDGYQYIMGLDGGFQLIKRLLKGDIKSDGEYLVCEFVQVKRGANLLIEAVED